MKALITGSAGLIGSACVGALTSRGWEVIGIDNDMRRRFFGPAGSTAALVASLEDQPKTKSPNLLQSCIDNAHPEPPKTPSLSVPPPRVHIGASL